MILEDDELNVPSVDTSDIPILTAVNITTVELKKPTDALNPEAQLDIESGPYVLEGCPLPALEEDGVTSVTIAQDRHLLPGPLEDMMHRQNTGDAQSVLEAPGADTLPELLNEGGGQADNVPEPERDMELASKEREDFSMAAPSSPLLHCHSTEPMREQMDKEQDRHGTSLGGLEEPKHRSPHHTQAEEEKPYAEQQKLEAVSAIVMVEDDRSMPDQAELAESRSYEDRREVGGGNTNWSECSGSSHSINDEDDKEPRPVKRQKLDAHSLSIATSLKLFDTEKSEPASLVMDPDREWEIRNIGGRKTVGGTVYYLIDWEPTWMAEFELDGARELMDEFVAQLQYMPREGWDGAGEGCSRRRHKIRGSDSLRKGEPKRRGRPRKQT